MIWLLFAAAYATYLEVCLSACCKEIWIKSIFLTLGGILILAILRHLLAYRNQNYPDSLLLLPIAISLYFAADAVFKTNHPIGGAIYLSFAILLSVSMWMSDEGKLWTRITWTIYLMLIAIVIFSISQLIVEFLLRSIFADLECVIWARRYFQVRPQVPGLVAGVTAFLLLSTETTRAIGSQYPWKVVRSHNVVVMVLVATILLSISTGQAIQFNGTISEKLLRAGLTVVHISLKTFVVFLSVQVYVMTRRSESNTRKILVIFAALGALIALALPNAIIHHWYLESFDDSRFADWFIVESTIMVSLMVSGIIAFLLFERLCKRIQTS